MFLLFKVLKNALYKTFQSEPSKRFDGAGTRILKKYNKARVVMGKRAPQSDPESAELY